MGGTILYECDCGEQLSADDERVACDGCGAVYAITVTRINGREG